MCSARPLWIACLAVLPYVGSGCASPASPADAEPLGSAEPAATQWSPEQQEVVAAIDGYLEAWNAQDADRLISFCDEGYDRIDARGNVYDTREAVHESYREVFARAAAGRRLSYEVLSVRLITPDVAVVDARYDLRNAPAAPEQRVEGMNTVVLVQRQGRWLRAAHRQRIPLSPDDLAVLREHRASE